LTELSLRQKASNALPGHEFVETEIKLPAAGLVRKCGSSDAGLQLGTTYNLYKRLLAIASHDAPIKFTRTRKSTRSLNLRSKRLSQERS
jgi:hypothetical protein